jgi:hypothetical protein
LVVVRFGFGDVVLDVAVVAVGSVPARVDVAGINGLTEAVVVASGVSSSPPKTVAATPPQHSTDVSSNTDRMTVTRRWLIAVVCWPAGGGVVIRSPWTPGLRLSMGCSCPDGWMIRCGAHVL